MTTKTPKLLGWVALAILLAWATYLCFQQPQVCIDWPNRHVAFMLNKGGQRAWVIQKWHHQKWPSYYHFDDRHPIKR